MVIGQPGRHIPVASALDHVFGYTIVNDVTARDRQVRTSPEGTVWYDLGRGKSFDTSAPLGPCIVTADEIADPQNLELATRINGDLRQSSTTAEMIWTCAELIHFFSTSFTLRPGMVVITGTPAGTAWSTDPELGGKWQGLPGLVPASRYCLPGDRIECTIECIGLLRNDVVHVAPSPAQVSGVLAGAVGRIFVDFITECVMNFLLSIIAHQRLHRTTASTARVGILESLARSTTAQR